MLTNEIMLTPNPDCKEGDALTMCPRQASRGLLLKPCPWPLPMPRPSFEINGALPNKSYSKGAVLFLRQ